MASPSATGRARSAPGRRSGTRSTPRQQAALQARQGVRYPTLEALDVIDPETMAPVPRDGATIGEIMIRGNTVMKGYLADPAATAGGVRRRLVPHGRPRGDARRTAMPRSRTAPRTSSSRAARTSPRSRSRRRSTAIRRCSRRRWSRRPDEKWGESPCAFVTLKDGAEATAEDLIAHCRSAARRLQDAQDRDLRAAAQNLHRQDPKAGPARAGPGGLSRLPTRSPR